MSLLLDEVRIDGKAIYAAAKPAITRKQYRIEHPRSEPPARCDHTGPTLFTSTCGEFRVTTCTVCHHVQRVETHFEKGQASNYTPRKAANKRRVKPVLGIILSAQMNTEWVTQFIAARNEETIIATNHPHVVDACVTAERKYIYHEPDTKSWGKYAIPESLQRVIDTSDKVVAFLTEGDNAALQAAHTAQKYHVLAAAWLGSQRLTPEKGCEIPLPPIQTNKDWEHIPYEALAKMKMLFGEHEGLPFSFLPFDYIDWLLGQAWFTGAARIYLTQWFYHERNEKELEEYLYEKQRQEDEWRFNFDIDNHGNAVYRKNAGAQLSNPNPDPEWKRLGYLGSADMQRSRNVFREFVKLQAEWFTHKAKTKRKSKKAK
jgi:hypothetical protein